MHGFCGRLLHIDVSSGRSVFHRLDASRLRQCLGGIGLGTSLLHEYAPAGVDPLSPANPLIWILAFMSLGRIIHGWKRSKDSYYHAPVHIRVKYGLAYLGLAALLAFSSRALQQRLYTQRHTQPVVMTFEEREEP